MKKPKRNYRRLKVYDFDGTLVWTPAPEKLYDGVPALTYYDAYLAENGLPARKWHGWWGRKETLQPPLLGEWRDGVLVAPSELLNEELALVHAEHRANPENLVILLTGRHFKMRHTCGTHFCELILKSYGLEFDEYYYNTSGEPTIKFKCRTLDALLDKHKIKDVEVFEDRVPHVSEFWNWIKLRKKEGHLDEGSVVQVFPPEYSK